MKQRKKRNKVTYKRNKVSKNGNVQLSHWAHESLVRRLSEKALTIGVSRSKLISQALSHYLDAS